MPTETTWRFAWSATVHLAGGAERYVIVGRRTTEYPCARPTVEYCVEPSEGRASRWVNERLLTLAEEA